MNLGVESRAGTMSMRSNINSTRSSHLSVGKSPVPYLFGGVGAMLVLIGFAMVILAWSYFKDCTTVNAEDEDSEKNERTGDMAEVSDEKDEIRVIVIMAGNEKPTFIAKPTSVAAAAVN